MPRAAARRRRRRRPGRAPRPGRGRLARRRYGDPLDAALRLAGRRAPSGSTWSTSTPPSGAATTASCSPQVVGRARRQGRAVRRHPRRRVAASAALATGCRAGQHRHRRAGEPGVVRRGHRRARRPDRRRPRRARHHPRRPRLDRRRAATSARCWPGSTRDGCARYVVTDVTKDGTLHGPEPRAAARRSARAPTARSSPPAASPASTTSRAARAGRRRASRARSSARRSTRARSPLEDALRVAGA